MRDWRGRRSARTAALQLGWLGSQAAAYRRFERAVVDPRRVQERRFRELVSLLGDSAMGRELGLDRVRGPEDFRERVPIGDYGSHRSWIDRVAAGEAGAMTPEPVEILERTGGTGGPTKYIPYTARLRAEFAEAVAVWMVDLHRALPRLIGTRSYWSISRAVREVETSEGGVPIGFEDDAAYFGPVARWAIGRMMAVPGEVARSESLEAWRLATAVHLVEAADLGLVSVWSPTFLTSLLRWVEDHREAVRERLTAGSRERFDRAVAWGPVNGAVLWPRLGVLSAWGDGFAERRVPELRRAFPGVPFQPKGVLATEGVLSIPLWGLEGSALALTAHGVELRDVDTGEVRWAHEARLGGRYQPLLTTGGGLVRYALSDVVEVVGFVGRVPRIRLVGRTDRGSDLAGEKLTEGFVREVLDGLGLTGFAMLVPVEEPLGYALVVDGEAPGSTAVDEALCEAYHYAYARELGQLQEVRVVRVRDGWTRWERAVESAGLVLGEQKPGVLESRPAVARALLAE